MNSCRYLEDGNCVVIKGKTVLCIGAGCIHREQVSVTMNDGGSADVQQIIREQCQAVSDILVAKNEAYGNSAIDPVRVFSKAPTDEQLNVRIDDKLSRLMRGENAGEDVELDLIGYLILKRVWRELNA